MATARLRQWASGNWFLLVLPVLFGISWLFVKTIDWRTAGGAAELVTVVDWTVSIPVLFFLCYRQKLDAKQMALRLLGMACLGVWVATWLVPGTAQEILPKLGWARTAGLAVLILIELRIVFCAVQFAFSADASAEELARRSGTPPLIAKLMLLEVKFWRAVWSFLKGR